MQSVLCCSPVHASSVGPAGIHRSPQTGGGGRRVSQPSECSVQRSTECRQLRKVLAGVDDGGLAGGLVGIMVGVGPSSLSLLPWSVEPPLDHSSGPFSAAEVPAAARAAAAAPAPTASLVAFAAGLRAAAAFFLGTPEAFPPLTLAAAPLP